MSAFVVTTRDGRPVNVAEFAHLGDADEAYAKGLELARAQRGLIVSLYVARDRHALAEIVPALAQAG